MNRPTLADMLTAAKQDLELFELEKMFVDRPKCESSHHILCPECSVEVTHLYTGCVGRKLACSKSADYVQESIDIDAFCGDCEQPCRDCWSIRPI